MKTTVTTHGNEYKEDRDHMFWEIKYKKLGKSLNKQVRNAIFIKLGL